MSPKKIVESPRRYVYLPLRRIDFDAPIEPSALSKDTRKLIDTIGASVAKKRGGGKFLIVGESGVGKSTIRRELERVLKTTLGPYLLNLGFEVSPRWRPQIRRPQEDTQIDWLIQRFAMKLRAEIIKGDVPVPQSVRDEIERLYRSIRFAAVEERGMRGREGGLEIGTSQAYIGGGVKVIKEETGEIVLQYKTEPLEGHIPTIQHILEVVSQHRIRKALAGSRPLRVLVTIDELGDKTGIMNALRLFIQDYVALIILAPVELYSEWEEWKNLGKAEGVELIYLPQPWDSIEKLSEYFLDEARMDSKASDLMPAFKNYLKLRSGGVPKKVQGELRRLFMKYGHRVRRIDVLRLDSRARKMIQLGSYIWRAIEYIRPDLEWVEGVAGGEAETFERDRLHRELCQLGCRILEQFAIRGPRSFTWSELAGGLSPDDRDKLQKILRRLQDRNKVSVLGEMDGEPIYLFWCDGVTCPICGALNEKRPEGRVCTKCGARLRYKYG